MRVDGGIVGKQLYDGTVEVDKFRLSLLEILYFLLWRVFDMQAVNCGNAGKLRFLSDRGKAGLLITSLPWRRLRE